MKIGVNEGNLDKITVEKDGAKMPNSEDNAKKDEERRGRASQSNLVSKISYKCIYLSIESDITKPEFI